MKSLWLVGITAVALAPLFLTGCSDSGASHEQVQGTLAEADKEYWIGDTTKAHQWLENAVAIQPDRTDTYFDGASNLGVAQITQNHGDYNELVKLLQPARKNQALAAEFSDIDGYLGDAYDRLGASAKSMAAYKAELADILASSTKPGAIIPTAGASMTALTKAAAEWGSGEHAAARTDLLHVRDTDPLNAPLAANNLAYFEAEARENLPEAETLARFAVAKATTADPDTLAGYQDTLGWVLHQEGKDSEALPYCQLASRNTPQLADCTYHLGVVYEAMGDVVNARNAYNHILVLQPLNPQAADGLARLRSRQPPQTS